MIQRFFDRSNRKYWKNFARIAIYICGGLSPKRRHNQRFPINYWARRRLLPASWFIVADSRRRFHSTRTVSHAFRTILLNSRFCPPPSLSLSLFTGWEASSWHFVFVSRLIARRLVKTWFLGFFSNFSVRLNFFLFLFPFFFLSYCAIVMGKSNEWFNDTCE